MLLYFIFLKNMFPSRPARRPSARREVPTRGRRGGEVVGSSDRAGGGREVSGVLVSFNVTGFSGLGKLLLISRYLGLRISVREYWGLVTRQRVSVVFHRTVDRPRG